MSTQYWVDLFVWEDIIILKTNGEKQNPIDQCPNTVKVQLLKVLTCKQSRVVD